MAQSGNSNRIILKNCLISYAFLTKPRQSKDNDGNVKGEVYSCQMIFPKTDTENVKKLKDAIELVKEQNKTRLANKNGIIPSNMKIPFRDGDTDGNTEGDPVYKGMYFLNATNYRNPPGIVDTKLNPILDSKEIYSGMYANVSITIKAFDNDNGKGIGAYLNNVQKVKDGKHLDGSIAADQEFTAYDDTQDI